MATSRPNILFIFTDQFRADCIGALGNPQIRTPNIDRLVRQGTSFTRCYSPSPVCAPARHALTSGEAPHITGCVDNMNVACTRPSFMNLLAGQGYQTHGVGKMHFARNKGDWGFESRDYAEELEGECPRDDYREHLVQNGFGHLLDPYGFRSEYYYLPQPSQLPDRLHTNAWITDRSIAFLERRDKSRPYFLWSSFIKPHPPFESPVPWSRLFRMHEMEDPFLPEGYEDHRNFWNRVQDRYKYMDSGPSSHLAKMIRAAYYSTIAHLDHHIGRLLDALGDEIDNTLIVFSSDHGEMLGDYGCYGKRSMLDASVRVPMIARWPDAFAANKTCENPSSLLDLFPTFVEAAGCKRIGQREGVSLQKLKGRRYRDRAIFSQFSQNRLGLYMAVRANLKYIYSAADDKEWLYCDRNESINLAVDPKFASLIEPMRQECIQRFRRDGYGLPLDGDDWRHFEPMEFPSDPQEGLLLQDSPALREALEELGSGYNHRSLGIGAPPFNLLRRLGQISMVPHSASTPLDGLAAAPLRGSTG